MIENYLHAGKTPYKLYHGYNFTSILELFNNYNYTLQTFYQSGGRFTIWFINKLDTSKRIKIIEYAKFKSFFLTGTIADPNDPEIYWPTSIKRKEVKLDDYFIKQNKTYPLDLNSIELKLMELENFFREENA